MIKKITALICILLCLCGCSKEEKFGLQQFVSRMNEQYSTTYKTADFMLGTDIENKKYFFYHIHTYTPIIFITKTVYSIIRFLSISRKQFFLAFLITIP